MEKRRFSTHFLRFFTLDQILVHSAAAQNFVHAHGKQSGLQITDENVLLQPNVILRVKCTRFELDVRRRGRADDSLMNERLEIIRRQIELPNQIAHGHQTAFAENIVDFLDQPIRVFAKSNRKRRISTNERKKIRLTPK